MKISRNDLRWALDQGLLESGQDHELWDALQQRTAGQPRFDVAHVAYYFGALLVIGAMGWFMTEAWEGFGGLGLFLIAAAYALAFILTGRTLWDERGLRIPGGLLFTMAVCMTPLAIYGLERATGLWPQDVYYQEFHFRVKGCWFLMEVGTILAALVALKFRRFPFLTAPIAVALWYMSMDLMPLFFGEPSFTWEQRLWASLCFGLAVLLVAYWVDLKNPDQDFAFWLYLFGLLAFSWGLSVLNITDSELSKFCYGLINLVLVAISVLLRRRVFIVFGALGVMGYVSHLAYRVFEATLMFPFVLTLLGIGIIYLGTVYQKNREAVEKAVQDWLPEAGRRLIPPRARSASTSQEEERSHDRPIA